MPSKSSRKKGKYSPQSKKKKSKTSRPAAVVAQPVAAEGQRPVEAPSVTVAPVEAPAQTARPAAVQYPFVAAELRTIGILASIMIVILVVLALFLA